MISFFGSPAWKPGKLQDLVLLQRGFDITKAEQKDGDIPVFSSSGPGSRHNVPKIQGPGVIIGRKGTLGSVFYCEGDYWPHDTTLWSKDLRGNNPRFVYYALQRIDMSLFDTGAANPTLNRNHIHGLPIFIPERSVQDRIAAILASYDDLIDNNRQRIALLEDAARQLYKEWFVRFRFPGHEHVKLIDGVPEGWEPISFSELADVLRGRSYTSAELREEGGRAFVNLKCIDRFGGFRDSGLKGIEGDFKEKHMVSPGDIVMAVTDMTRDAMIVAQSGRIAKTVEENAIFSMDLVKIVPKPEIQKNWLYSFLRFSRFAFDVREHATGTNVLHLKPKYISEWTGILPPTKIRGWFVDIVQPMFDQIDNLQLQSRNTAQARDLLLPRLMNGTLAV